MTLNRTTGPNTLYAPASLTGLHTFILSMLNNDHDSASQTRPTITVLYFAAAFTAVGIAREVIKLPVNNDRHELKLSALGQLLVEKHPDKGLDSVLRISAWSVDAEMVEDPENILLRGGEEVAIICPVSGG